MQIFKNRRVSGTRNITHRHAGYGRSDSTGRSLSNELIGGRNPDVTFEPSGSKHRSTSKNVPFIWRVNYRNEITPPEMMLEIAHEKARQYLQRNFR
ncbi:MAG: hypothetical protein WCF66_19565 [Pseudolabrys sp.]